MNTLKLIEIVEKADKDYALALVPADTLVKFAELIVRECACIADDMKSLETARAIKEHFGLEEGTMNTFTPIDPGPAATKEIADARNDVLDGLL